MSSPIFGASPYRQETSRPAESPPPVLQQPSAPPAESDAPPVKRECNDFLFLLPFLAVVVATVVVAAKYGDDFISATNVEGLSESSGVTLMLRIVGLSALAAAGLSVVWIAAMVLLAEVLIWVALGTIVALNIAAAIFLTKKAYDSGADWYWWPAVVFGLLALLTILYVSCIRKRIKFAAAHLKVAGKAIFRLPMTLLVALVMVGVQIGWAVLWVLGSLGVMFHQDYIKLESAGCTTESCDLKYKTGAIVGVLCGMLLVYFWVTFVLRNVIGVTTAGTVAAWKNAANTPFITMGAWLRAVTLNLGSICFGSLIVAILETVVWILHLLAWLAGRSGNCCLSCLFSCLSCLISCIESWIEFFNRFAYAYVGCYGYSFVTASRHVFKLFAAKGWSAIVNDDLTGNVFWLGSVLIGAATAYIGVQLVDGADSARLAMFAHPHVFVAFFCFCVGYGVNNLFMSVVASAVTTIFVLWAEDPHGWQLTRPKHFDTLHKAWLKIYPDEYNNGYGKQHSADVDGRV
ncbi:putative choline transporter, neither null mutation nor overexpression affects choline transport [Phytophthora pseudosyringae]|uniref:Choline transporter-like protein n=1 Tax=Phytophthora pseudosyringae TaxID=221518 RepID=A0A8T1VWJ4_9STRA|nr:putative choline transporter, neither null mutation nor overexpression affects choline transport [Phytophthora pseudosyringae]